jgi:hypothetical protein
VRPAAGLNRLADTRPQRSLKRSGADQYPLEPGIERIVAAMRDHVYGLLAGACLRKGSAARLAGRRRFVFLPATLRPLRECPVVAFAHHDLSKIRSTSAFAATRFEEQS